MSENTAEQPTTPQPHTCAGVKPPLHTVEVPAADVASAFQTAINKTIHDAWQEGYQQALRDTVQKASAALEVHELGEDGDMWLVKGEAALAPVIRVEVAKWVIATLGVDDIDATEKISELRNSRHTYRDDWVYVPQHQDYPDEECLLKPGADAPEHLERFAGTLVQL